MNIREITERWIAGRFNTGVLTWSLILLGVALIGFGLDSYPRLITVGVLYGLIGVGFILLEGFISSRLDIRMAWQVILVVFAVLFAFVLGELAWTRAGYAPIGASLVLDVMPLAVDRFLKIAPVGLFIVLGFADESQERMVVVPPIVIWVGFVGLMELLSSYHGFGWPVLPLIMTLGWLVLVLLSGMPLYVLGVALKHSTR